MSKHTTLEQLRKLAVRTKSELDAISGVANGAIRSGEFVNHVAKFYTSTDKTGAPAFTMDFPEEMVIDLLGTKFVENFTWSNEAYPGSTEPNPSLDGNPVFVIAVKGEDASVNPSYSFLNMKKLVDTYSPAAGDGSATVSVSGYNIGVNVNLSDDPDNILTKDTNGKLLAKHQNISGKADKDTDAVEGNFAAFDDAGNPVDSHKSASDFLSATAAQNKADKPNTAVENNLAAFDGNKNPVDSGIAKGDVQKKLAENTFTEGNVRTSDVNGFAQDGGVALSALLQGTAATDREVDDMLDEVFGTATSNND